MDCKRAIYRYVNSTVTPPCQMEKWTIFMLHENDYFLCSKFLNIFSIFVVVVELVFYGPSIHFKSFRARSVNLSTLFLDKSPRQFTST